MNNSLLGVKIGIIFTFLSLLLTITIIIPAFSIFPGVIIELIAKGLVDNKPYSNVGQMTILLLASIFFISIIATIFYVRKNSGLTKIRVVIIMLIFWLIVHPLVFYIYWGIKWEYRSDGQLILGAVETFPISSISFIIIGGIIDIVEKLTFNKKSPNISV